jgi:hypothetical protein
MNDKIRLYRVIDDSGDDVHVATSSMRDAILYLLSTTGMIEDQIEAVIDMGPIEIDVSKVRSNI